MAVAGDDNIRAGNPNNEIILATFIYNHTDWYKP